jgi:hypothetical protein
MNKVFVVEKISNQWRSKRTNGWCITVVARDLDTGKSYKTYPDTTFSSYGAWSNLRVNDKFTNVSILNEQKRIMSSANYPRIVNRNSQQIALI